MPNATGRSFVPLRLGSLGLGLAVLAGLWAILQWHGFLLFHCLVELGGIVIAFGIFTVFWNARRFLDNGCFLFLGIAYLFVGVLDLLHTLAYKGMGVFEVDGANLATQLWIGGRYVESVSILAAPVFLYRRFHPYLLLSAYALVVCTLLVSIFHWRVFPTCFIDGEGLTPFKIVSEAIVCVILAAALVILHRRREGLDRRVYRLLSASVLITIASELAFTQYEDVFGRMNAAGHFLKLISYYLVYVAFVEVALTNPYSVLFRNLRESEASLRRSEFRFRGTFENAAVGIAHVDLDGRWLRVNEKLCGIVGYPREEILRKKFHDLTPVDDLEANLGRFRALARGEINSYTAEQRYLHAEGRIVWVLLTMALQRDDAGRPMYSIAVIQDITARKDAERRLHEVNETLEHRVAERTWLAEQRASQLRMLASELTRTEQRERRRLAHILHDHLQQILATAKLKVSVLRRREGDPAAREAFCRINELLQEAIAASRSLTVELSPPILYDAGLIAALEWLARHVQENHGLTVHVDADPAAEPESEDLRLLLFQAARELLFNVVKHAQAGAAQLAAARVGDDQIEVSVADDGKGFDPALLETPGEAGFGLYSVRERIGLAGGRMEIESRPGGGTKAAVVAPRRETARARSSEF